MEGTDVYGGLLVVCWTLFDLPVELQPKRLKRMTHQYVSPVATRLFSQEAQYRASHRQVEHDDCG